MKLKVRCIERTFLLNSNVRHQSLLRPAGFGNVIGSSGSVIPLFKEQIKVGGPITITDRSMTRFVMSLKEAAKLVIKACELAKGGEVFITKMPVLNINDLADVMIEELAPKFGYKPSAIEKLDIGPKPGEKIYEELMSEDEVARSVELEDMFVTIPAIIPMAGKIDYSYSSELGSVKKAYVSCNEPLLSKEEIRNLLKGNNTF